MSSSMEDLEVTIVQTTSQQARYKRLCSHYALISIDDAGNLHFEASPSISSSRERILSSGVMEEFLQAVARSKRSQAAVLYAQRSEVKLLAQSPPSLPNEDRATQCTGPQTAQQPWEPPFAASTLTPLPWSADLFHRSDSKTEALKHEVRALDGEADHSSRIAIIPLGNSALLRQYYAKVFHNLQQTNCRIISKVYIKLVEPRKQVNFPYNGRKTLAGITQQLDPDETKPPWWPKGVSHREPDHLPKAERIQLLVHILCHLRTSHGVTARRLRHADQTIRRQILPATRLELLDEMYNIREKEEMLLDREIDMNAQVVISRINLPDEYNAASITTQQPDTSGSSHAHNPKVEFKRRNSSPYGKPAPDVVQDVSPIAYAAFDIPDHFTQEITPAGQAVPALTPDSSEDFLCTQGSLLSAGRTVPIDHYAPVDASFQSTIPIPRQVTSYFPYQGGDAQLATQYAMQTLGTPMDFYEN